MDKNNLKLIGNKIRETRKSRNFDLLKLSHKIGVAYGTMANIESGNKKPTIEQLSKIGEVLNCDWKEFLHDGKKLVTDVDEMEQLIKEEEKRVRAIKNEIDNNIRNSIQLNELLYSPTGTLLSEQELNDIKNLVLHTIKIRLGQIANSKQNK